MHAGAHRTAEALAEIIEALHLLLQAHAGMCQLQPPLGGLQAHGRDPQLAAHAAGQTLRACAPVPQGRRGDPAPPARRPPDGVGARASATKSAMVKSISWPTPQTTGSEQA